MKMLNKSKERMSTVDWNQNICHRKCFGNNSIYETYGSLLNESILLCHSDLQDVHAAAYHHPLLDVLGNPLLLHCVEHFGDPALAHILAVRVLQHAI